MDAKFWIALFALALLVRSAACDWFDKDGRPNFLPQYKQPADDLKDYTQYNNAYQIYDFDICAHAGHFTCLNCCKNNKMTGAMHITSYGESHCGGAAIVDVMVANRHSALWPSEYRRPDMIFVNEHRNQNDELTRPRYFWPPLVDGRARS
jgi:hypothetical protein